MKSVLPIYDNRALKAWANACELQNSHEEITRALRSGTKYILLTGKSHNGKSSLLHTITKEIPANQRIIFIKGKELSFSNNLIKSDTYSGLSEDENKYVYDFNSFVEFIVESIKINEKLVIVIDDADHLPIERLKIFFKINTNVISKNYAVQFLMTGLPKLEKILRAIDCITTGDFIHSSIDALSSETTHSITATKKHRIESNINKVELDQNLLEIFTKIVNTGLQVIVVLLERSSALTKKYVLSKISKNTVFNAIDSVQQYLKHSYKKLIETNLYSQQLTKNVNHVSIIIKSSIKKLINDSGLTSRIYIKKVTNFPKYISKIYNTKFNLPSIFSPKAELELEDEIESTLKKYNTEKNLPGWDFNTAVILFVISLALIISYRLQPSNLEHESSTEALLAKNDMSNSFTDNSTLVNQNKNIALKEKTNNSATIQDNTEENIITNSSATKEKSANGVVNTVTHNSSSSPNQELEINNLLAIAAQQYEAKKLTTPAGDNAYETYQYILFVNPTHEAALQGLKKVHNRYVSWANYDLQNNNGAKARYFFNKALNIEPDNQATLRALEDLKEAEDSLADGTNPLLLTANQSREIQVNLNKANVIMQKIDTGIVSNERDFRIYQDAQLTYQNILMEYPKTAAAKTGLIKIKNYYLDWAELEFQNQNYNTALFLYEQAFSIQPNNTDIKRRIEKIRMVTYKGG